jgi:hypothetical protein
MFQSSRIDLVALQYYLILKLTCRLSPLKKAQNSMSPISTADLLLLGEIAKGKFIANSATHIQASSSLNEGEAPR